MLLLGIAGVAQILFGVAAKHLAFVTTDGTLHHGFRAHGCFGHRLLFRHSLRLRYFSRLNTLKHRDEQIKGMS